MKAVLEWVTPNPEHEIVLGMLSCRHRWDGIADVALAKPLEKRIDDLWTAGHYGCFEEAYACIIVTGISRSFTHQDVRHRLFSFKQISMRTVPFVEENVLITKYWKSALATLGKKYVSGLDVIVPPSIESEKSGLAKTAFEDAVYACRLAYQELLRLGIPEEDARFIAPIGTESQIRMTGNFRTWIHFLNMRTPKSRDRNERYVAGRGPQWEIREFAWRCYDLLKKEAPNVFHERYMELWKYV